MVLCLFLRILCCFLTLDALRSPIPSSHNTQGHHELSGVNQAYRLDKEDAVHVTNHDSWDDSENDPVSQSQQSYVHNQGKDALVINDEQNAGNNHKQVERSKRDKQDKSKSRLPGLDLVQQRLDVVKDLQFDDCCLVQAAHGAFDDRSMFFSCLTL